MKICTVLHFTGAASGMKLCQSDLTTMGVNCKSYREMSELHVNLVLVIL